MRTPYQPLAPSVLFTTRRASVSRRELIFKRAPSAATRFTSNCNNSRSTAKLIIPPAARKSGVSPTVRTPAPCTACRTFAYRFDSERLTKPMWQSRSSWSLCTHFTSTCLPCGDAPRANSASAVPNEKSPRTQMRKGDCAEGNALSGQSMKLGKVAKKFALLRYSAAVDCWAASGGTAHASRQATAAASAMSSVSASDRR